MQRQIVVIGLGALGASLARALANRGVMVIAVDSSPELVQDIKDEVAVALCLDCTDEKALREAISPEIDAAVVCIGTNVEANLLTVALLKKLGVGNIHARATTPLQVRILRAMDVENIVNVEQQMGIMLANRLVSPDIETVVPLATGHSIAQVRVPRTWVGKTLRELDLRRRSRVNVVAIKRMVPDVDDQGERFMRYDVNDVPTPDDTLREADVMVVVGANEDIRNLTQE
jgi:trk system potassium uptake protein TrkA